MDDFFIDAAERGNRPVQRQGGQRLVRVQVKDVLRLFVARAPFPVFAPPEPDDPVALSRLRRSTLDALFVATLDATKDRLLARDRGLGAHLVRELSFRRRLHRAILVEGIASGVVLPYIDADHPDVGFLGYVGILPRARGRSVATLATKLAIRLLALEGARTIIAVTDRQCAAMRAIVARLGFEPVAAQEVWGAPTAGAARRSGRR